MATADPGRPLTIAIAHQCPQPTQATQPQGTKMKPRVLNHQPPLSREMIAQKLADIIQADIHGAWCLVFMWLALNVLADLLAPAAAQHDGRLLFHR